MSRQKTEPFLLAAILLLAALLRFYALDAIPPGLTHDEADFGFYAAAVARGAPAHYDVPYGYAYEPFGQYSAGLLMRFMGANDYTLRVHQVLYGLLAVGLTYAWARMAFGWRVAAGASALEAVLFWPVFTSRMALNSQPLPAMLLLAVVALWRALYPVPSAKSYVFSRLPRLKSWANCCNFGLWAVFALSVAAILHIYEAGRAAWFAFPAFFVYLLLADRARLRKHGRAFALALGVGTALALPHLLDPGSWGRTGAQIGAVHALFAGDLGPFVTNLFGGLGTITVSGDTLVTYNIPGRPLVGPLVGVFFYVGAVAAALGAAKFLPLKRTACAFLLLWLIFGLAPTLVVGAYTSTLHSIAVQPVVCILPALGAAWLAKRPLLRVVVPVLWIAALAWTGFKTAQDYFVTWGRSADVRGAYFNALAAITDRLDADAGGGVVAISSPFPEPPLDPFIGQMRVHNPAVDMRWMDARYAVILPPVDTMRLITTSNTWLDPALAAPLAPALIETVHMRPDDMTRWYRVYRLVPEAARERLAGHMALDGEVVFGGAVRLQGCAAEKRAGTLDLMTLWEVMDPGALGVPPATQYAHELAIFVHALDGDRNIIAQADKLGMPAAGWRAGDWFVHIHHIEGGAQAEALWMGIYNRVDRVRLPLAVNGSPKGDALAPLCTPGFLGNP